MSLFYGCDALGFLLNGKDKTVTILNADPACEKATYEYRE
jgi:hypothetical protein